ncbi:MAG: cobalamin B12-binding domain-containing protein [Dethiobacteraceae bacterium]|nr:cobalamin-binding protein [Bacillota bacterium]
MREELLRSFVDMDEQEAVRIARELVETEGGAVAVLDTCKEAMEEVGRLFEAGEYFLSELIAAGDMFNQIMEFTLPKLQGEEVASLGTMVLGTVQGDVHNIGKDIFKVMAEASGINVIDIGIDVPHEKFVEAIKEHKPELVGMCCLITLGVDSMKRTIEVIKEAGLRDDIKIIIGGGRVSQAVMEHVGADAWADDAARGVRLSKELLGKE